MRMSTHLSFQELDLDPNGRPALMSAPLDSLRDDFPLRPRLAGALVPQNVNLWMGHTKSGGSSSGLHHDFHDNLYMLLRGKKTFRCAPKGGRQVYKGWFGSLVLPFVFDRLLVLGGGGDGILLVYVVGDGGRGVAAVVVGVAAH